MRAALALSMLAAPAAAQPTYFAAPDRPLAVLDAPDGARVGQLRVAPGPVEALDIDATGAWALVALPESGGWIAVAGLAPVSPPLLSWAPIPAGLRCIGTEPFWSLDLAAEGATFAEPGNTAPAAVEAASWPSGEALPLPLRIDAPGFGAAGLLQGAACSDGMSDRPYGWALDLVATGAQGARRFSGCCFLPRGG